VLATVGLEPQSAENCILLLGLSVQKCSRTIDLKREIYYLWQIHCWFGRIICFGVDTCAAFGVDTCVFATNAALLRTTSAGVVRLKIDPRFLCQAWSWELSISCHDLLRVASCEKVPSIQIVNHLFVVLDKLCSLQVQLSVWDIYYVALPSRSDNCRGRCSFNCGISGCDYVVCLNRKSVNRRETFVNWV